MMNKSDCGQPMSLLLGDDDEHLLRIVMVSHYDRRFEATGDLMRRIGVYVFGIAAVAYGITDFVWGEFDPSDGASLSSRRKQSSSAFQFLKVCFILSLS